MILFHSERQAADFFELFFQLTRLSVFVRFGLWEHGYFAGGMGLLWKGGVRCVEALPPLCGALRALRLEVV